MATSKRLFSFNSGSRVHQMSEEKKKRVPVLEAQGEIHSATGAENSPAFCITVRRHRSVSVRLLSKKGLKK